MENYILQLDIETGFPCDFRIFKRKSDYLDLKIIGKVDKERVRLYNPHKHKYIDFLRITDETLAEYFPDELTEDFSFQFLQSFILATFEALKWQECWKEFPSGIVTRIYF